MKSDNLNKSGVIFVTALSTFIAIALSTLVISQDNGAQAGADYREAMINGASNEKAIQVRQARIVTHEEPLKR